MEADFVCSLPQDPLDIAEPGGKLHPLRTCLWIHSKLLEALRTIPARTARLRMPIPSDAGFSLELSASELAIVTKVHVSDVPQRQLTQEKTMFKLAATCFVVLSCLCGRSEAADLLRESFTDGQISPMSMKFLNKGGVIKVSEGKFSPKVTGGSCGVCGEGDAIFLEPALAPIAGGFTADLDFSQDERKAVGGSSVFSGIYLEMKNPTGPLNAASISVALIGDSFPSGQSFHGVVGETLIDNISTARKEVEISKDVILSGTWKFAISRNGSSCTLQFFNPQGQDVLQMTSDACPEADVIPSVVVFSGSGGSNTQNGTFGATLKKMRISKP